MNSKKLNLKRRIYANVLKTIMYLSLTIVVAIMLFIVIYVFKNGLSHITWQFLSTKPSYINKTIGILPDILNTIYIVIATLLIVLPIGVGAAIYLNEYATNQKIVNLIEYTTEALSGIPSIIYGLIGVVFFCEILGLKTSLISGALTLVIMNLPTIIRTTQESLKTVPQSYKEGAFGLGAGKWRVIKTVVLPNCIDGIITGCILATGRIVGETAALFYTAGFAHEIGNFFEAMANSGATLTVSLYLYAKESAKFDVAFAIASILLILTFLFNIGANLIQRHFTKRRNS